MSLLDTLKSLLGLGSSTERRSRQREVGVTVEHEPGEVQPETGTEDAVKGTDASAAAETREPPGRERGGGSAEADDDVDIPDAEDLASGSGTAGGDRAEADEAVTIPDAEEISGAADESAADAEPSGTEAEPGGAEADVEPEAADEPTDVVKGIGSTYAERLAEGGIETVGDLAAADPAEVAAEADVSESRLERWIQRARER